MFLPVLKSTEGALIVDLAQFPAGRSYRKGLFQRRERNLVIWGWEVKKGSPEQPHTPSSRAAHLSL